MKRGMTFSLIIAVLFVGTAPQALGYGHGTFSGRVVDSGVQPEWRPPTKIELKVKRNKIKVTTVDLVLYCGGSAIGFPTATATVGGAHGKVRKGVPTFPNQGSFAFQDRVQTTTSLGPATIGLLFTGSVLLISFKAKPRPVARFYDIRLKIKPKKGKQGRK